MATQISPPVDREHDSRWTAVDKYAEKHLLLNGDLRLQKALANCVRISDAAGLATPIAVSALQGSFLALQCRLLRVKNVLEVGSLGGYSALWMASASEEIKVTTVDIDEASTSSVTQAAKEAFEKYGFTGGKRIEAINGAGLDILPGLVEEVRTGKRDKFEWVFIDADKSNNLAYLELALDMCKPGACIVVDNIVRNGMLAMSETELKELGVDQDQEYLFSIEGSKRVVEAVGSLERVAESTVLQVVSDKGYDGMLMCIVK